MASKPAIAFSPRSQRQLIDRCGQVCVILVDCRTGARQRRARRLRRWGHCVQSYADPEELPLVWELPPRSVLIARQEHSREPGIECIQSVQSARADIAAILLTLDWSSALASVVSTRKSLWMRSEPIADEDLHALVDLCVPVP